jgi:hypothetical protein
MLVGNLQAQQVPIPQTAAEVTGPAPGPMTKAYPAANGHTQWTGQWDYRRNRKSERGWPRQQYRTAGHVSWRCRTYSPLQAFRRAFQVSLIMLHIDQ